MATSKACAGCGKTGEDAYDKIREKGEVCGDCKIDLEYARQCREAVEKKLDNGDYGVYRIPWHAPSYYYHALEHSWNYKHEKLGEIFKALCLFIVDELTEFVPKRDISAETITHGFMKGTIYKHPGISEIENLEITNLLDLENDMSHNADVVIIRKELAETIQSLHEEFKETIRITARTVGETGSSLLLKVASGEMTVEELNKHSLDLEKYTRPPKENDID